MAKVKDKAAYEKVIRARTNLLIGQGFFGVLALQLRIVECTVLPTGQANDTMAVDGKNLYYNAEFVTKLTDREVEAVWAHEVMHCALQHFSRLGHRDPWIWNLAGDFVINADLKHAGFTLPVPHLYDQKYEKMTTEDVYEDLYKNAKKITVTISYGKGKGGDGKKQMDPGQCGGVIEAPGGEQGQSEAQQTWESNVRQAIAVAKANNAGTVPGYLQRLVDQLEQPKVSWRDLTRRFIDQSMSKDISWARLSRRSTALGTWLPGYISDALNHLIMVVDVSGSINEPLLREFVSEVAGALDQGTCDRLTVLYADTHVRHVDEWVKGDLVTPTIIGGGGTDFRDSFEWITANAPDASCVIYLTDMYTSDFGDDPGMPTLWAVYSQAAEYEQLLNKAPFGSGVWVGSIYG
jgi:predicted metal-dependent peptidase